MTCPKRTLNRRNLLQQASSLGASALAPAWAQPGKQLSASKNAVIAQTVDFSRAQQDASKDFLIGSRAARWQPLR